MQSVLPGGLFNRGAALLTSVLSCGWDSSVLISSSENSTCSYQLIFIVRTTHPIFTWGDNALRHKTWFLGQSNGEPGAVF